MEITSELAKLFFRPPNAPSLVLHALQTTASGNASPVDILVYCEFPNEGIIQWNWVANLASTQTGRAY